MGEVTLYSKQGAKRSVASPRAALLRSHAVKTRSSTSTCAPDSEFSRADGPRRARREPLTPNTVELRT